MTKRGSRPALGLGLGRSRALDPRDRFLQIALVHLDADEVEPELRARDRRRSESKERIRDGRDPIDAVEPQAHLGKARRKRRRMRPILFAALNRVVGNEPRVAAAAQVLGGRAPAGDVRLVLISHADRLAAERRVAVGREMEHELVTVVQEALAVDWLVVADREIVLEPGARARERLLDGDRLDPVDGVLQLQMRTRGLRHVERGPRIGRLAPDVQKQRALLAERSRRQRDPVTCPLEIA